MGNDNKCKGWLKPSGCSHVRAYYFHENAPQYCPDCGSYVDGGVVVVGDDEAVYKNLDNSDKDE